MHHLLNVIAILLAFGIPIAAGRLRCVIKQLMKSFITQANQLDQAHGGIQVLFFWGQTVGIKNQGTGGYQLGLGSLITPSIPVYFLL